MPEEACFSLPTEGIEEYRRKVGAPKDSSRSFGEDLSYSFDAVSAFDIPSDLPLRITSEIDLLPNEEESPETVKRTEGEPLETVGRDLQTTVGRDLQTTVGELLETVGRDLQTTEGDLPLTMTRGGPEIKSFNSHVDKEGYEDEDEKILD